jgi:hypothetical protein
MTKKDAAQRWIREFNAIPQELLLLVLQADPNCIWEVTQREETDDEPMDFFPMWATMWSFGECIDNDWLEHSDNIKRVSGCGIRVYETSIPQLPYVLGIDGAGYDFYEAHWIPLYEERGLRWHEEVAA